MGCRGDGRLRVIDLEIAEDVGQPRDHHGVDIEADHGERNGRAQPDLGEVLVEHVEGVQGVGE